jgi:hypothetical protein
VELHSIVGVDEDGSGGVVMLILGGVLSRSLREKIKLTGVDSRGNSKLFYLL